MSEGKNALERAWAIEKLLETLLPDLIKGSPNRDSLTAALAALAQTEPDDTQFPEDGIAADLAADLLQRLQAP